MKKLTKDNQLESNLELQYVFALSDKCPVECRSISGYVNNFEPPLPKSFLVLHDFAKKFFSYLNNSKARQAKNKNIFIEDVEIYFAWKIWKEKRLDPKNLIFNSVCRNKAILLGNKSMVEIHKSASRILRVKNQLTETIANCKDETLTNTLEEIKTSVYIHTEIAVTFYNKVLENYNESLKEIDLYILDQQKLGGTNGD
jgi:hypothetical protein